MVRDCIGNPRRPYQGADTACVHDAPPRCRPTPPRSARPAAGHGRTATPRRATAHRASRRRSLRLAPTAFIHQVTTRLPRRPHQVRQERECARCSPFAVRWDCVHNVSPEACGLAGVVCSLAGWTRREGQVPLAAGITVWWPSGGRSSMPAGPRSPASGRSSSVTGSLRWTWPAERAGCCCLTCGTVSTLTAVTSQRTCWPGAVLVPGSRRWPRRCTGRRCTNWTCRGQQAGFDRIRVEGGYAHADPARDSDVLVFIAHKPHD